MNKIGSRSIGKLVSAIARLDNGNGVQINYERLLEESGIATVGTLWKAIKEAAQQGVIEHRRGGGKKASWYRVNNVSSNQQGFPQGAIRQVIIRNKLRTDYHISTGNMNSTKKILVENNTE